MKFLSSSTTNNLVRSAFKLLNKKSTENMIGIGGLVIAAVSLAFTTAGNSKKKEED